MIIVVNILVYFSFSYWKLL